MQYKFLISFLMWYIKHTIKFMIVFCVASPTFWKNHLSYLNRTHFKLPKNRGWHFDMDESSYAESRSQHSEQTQKHGSAEINGTSLVNIAVIILTRRPRFFVGRLFSIHGPFLLKHRKRKTDANKMTILNSHEKNTDVFLPFEERSVV